ncbi:hypothetical protein [Aeromonas allosaccharophila]|uniref:hypothetical protein n=1 Tax=Aeromonas allosaccharophila TaxID=656 RepID=UPI002ADFA9EA|nr:hypothetical protein [Aeromonas allosaccharophila]
MAPPRRPKGRKDSALAEKKKTPQLATVGPSKIADKLLAIAHSAESILKLANTVTKLVRLAIDVYKHLEDIIT